MGTTRAADGPGGFRAGAAVEDITPPLGTPLAGWNERRIADRVHRPLSVRALVFAGIDGGGAAEMRGALVALDVLGVDAAWVDGVRRRVEDTSDIPRDGVLVAATHTHSGPPTALAMPEVPPAPPGLLDGIADRVVAAVGRAQSALVPVAVRAARAHVGFPVNRRLVSPEGRVYWPPRANPGGPVDDDVVVVRFDAERGCLATLFTCACHPTVSGPSRWISPDYPGAARDAVEAALGGTGVFLLGNCGDVRSNLTLPDGRFRWETTPEEVAAVGRTLADAVLAAARAGERIAPEPVAVAGARCALRLRDGGAACEAEFQAVRWGEVAVLANPGETFAAVGLEVKRRLGGRLLLASCANGYAGYVPTADAYPLGGYEVDAAHRWWRRDEPFAPDTADLFVETLLSVARRTGVGGAG